MTLKLKTLIWNFPDMRHSKKYGSAYCLLGRDDYYATVENPQCPHPEGLRYEKYQELSKMMLDILIPNRNFITRYFSVKALSSTLKENGRYSTSGDNRLKELWRDDSICVSITRWGMGWDTEHKQVVEATTCSGEQAE